MSENEFWVRPREFPPFVAPIRDPVMFHTANQMLLTEGEIQVFKKMVRKELEIRNPNLISRRAACSLAAENAKVFSEISSFFTVITAVLTTIYHLAKLFYYRINTTSDISLFQIIEYLVKTSPFTYASILLFFLILLSIGTILDIERDKAQKKLREIEKEVLDFIDSEYTSAYTELISEKTARLNGELSRKEFIQAKATFTRAEDAHKMICDQIVQKCNKLCGEAVSISNRYVKKLAGVNEALGRLDASIKEVEQTFKENRYAPFWKAVEECFDVLMECDEEFKGFRGLQVDRYYAIRNDQASVNNLLHLPVADFDIHAPQETLIRLNALIRKTQSIIEFATIHQMIETRREIVEGFENLHTAVESVGWNISQTIVATSVYLARELNSLGRNISDSIDNAANRISSSVVDANEANIEAIELLNDSVTEASGEMLQLAEQSESAREEAYERLERQAEKQVDALDDIRRGRIPIGPNPRKRLTRPK